MRHILSAAGTYNYKLAKWLDEKLKPLSTNEHTIDDIFSFADDLPEVEISDHDILVSYDVSALFTKVPVEETTEILATKAFKEDWFNKEYSHNNTKADQLELLEVPTKISCFHFKGFSTNRWMESTWVLKMSLKLRNLNLQLSTTKTLYISLSVICVMQIMSALQADTYINMWRSTNDR